MYDLSNEARESAKMPEMPQPSSRMVDVEERMPVRKNMLMGMVR